MRQRETQREISDERESVCRGAYLEQDGGKRMLRLIWVLI
jgi:hypothetical protein